MGVFSDFDIAYDFPQFAAEVKKRYFSVETEAANPADFSAYLSSWRLGQTGISHMRAKAMRHHRVSAHMANGEDDYLLVPISSSTEISFRQGRNEVSMGREQFLLQLSSRPYEYTQHKAGEVWTLLVPLRDAKRHINRLDSYTPFSFDASRGVGRVFYDMVQTVPQRSSELNVKSAEGVSELLLEMLALALENDDRVLGSGQSNVRKAMLYRVEKYIRDNLSDPDLNAEKIAGAMGYSVRYLHQIFADAEVSLARWIALQRLERCRHALQTAPAHETISGICFRWGFASETHFSRKFKSHFGLSPSEYRKNNNATLQ